MTNEAPARLYVQIYERTVGDSIFACEADPREVHDNGKPVYEYVLAEVGEAKIEAKIAVLTKAAWDLCGFLRVTPMRLDVGDSMTLSMLTDALRAALVDGKK